MAKENKEVTENMREEIQAEIDMIDAFIKESVTMVVGEAWKLNKSLEWPFTKIDIHTVISHLNEVLGDIVWETKKELTKRLGGI